MIVFTWIVFLSAKMNLCTNSMDMPKFIVEFQFHLTSSGYFGNFEKCGYIGNPIVMDTLDRLFDSLLDRLLT